MQARPLRLVSARATAPGSLGHGDDPADAVRTGVDAVCTGAACFGFAARSVLRAATCSFCGGGGAGAASDFDPPNRLPIRPAIEVGFSCWAGVSPCLGCGAGCGIGTLATVAGPLGCCGDCNLARVTAPRLGVLGNAPGTSPESTDGTLVSSKRRPLLSPLLEGSFDTNTGFIPPSPTRNGTVDTPLAMYCAILSCSCRRSSCTASAIVLSS